MTLEAELPIEIATLVAPLDVKPPPVQGTDAWADAGRNVLRLHFGRLVARVPGVVEGADPEEVHGMRVAARRMRAAWRVFGDAFARDVGRRMVADLRDVGRLLGRVRDRDVLLGILDAYSAELDLASLAALRADWQAERAAGHAELVANLSSRAFAGFVHEYEDFLRPGAADHERAGVAHAPVRILYPGRAWTAYGALAAYAERVQPTRVADLATFHQVRIAGKWLRYTLEFARDALGSDAASLIEPVVALQDHLGEQHDLHEGVRLAHDYLERAQPSRAERSAISRLVRDFDRSVVRYTAGFKPIWRPIVAKRYRTTLGRSLTRL